MSSVTRRLGTASSGNTQIPNAGITSGRTRRRTRSDTPFGRQLETMRRPTNLHRLLLQNPSRRRTRPNLHLLKFNRPRRRPVGKLVATRKSLTNVGLSLRLICLRWIMFHHLRGRRPMIGLCSASRRCRLCRLVTMSIPSQHKLPSPRHLSGGTVRRACAP